MSLVFLSVGAGLMAVSSGCSSVPTPPSPPPTVVAPGVANPQLLSNAASLLEDLMSDEKNLKKVLIIKGHSDGDFGTLVKAISHAAEQGERELQGLAQTVPGIDPKALGLPPGEVAARKAIAKTKEHDLLFTAGNNFEYNLLLTQSQALSYGSHLAQVVADNAPTHEAEEEFHALSEVLDRLLKQVTVEMRQLPAT